MQTLATVSSKVHGHHEIGTSTHKAVLLPHSQQHHPKNTHGIHRHCTAEMNTISRRGIALCSAMSVCMAQMQKNAPIPSNLLEFTNSAGVHQLNNTLLPPPPVTNSLTATVLLLLPGAAPIPPSQHPHHRCHCQRCCHYCHFPRTQQAAAAAWLPPKPTTDMH